MDPEDYYDDGKNVANESNDAMYKDLDWDLLAPTFEEYCDLIVSGDVRWCLHMGKNEDEALQYLQATNPQRNINGTLFSTVISKVYSKTQVVLSNSEQIPLQDIIRETQITEDKSINTSTNTIVRSALQLMGDTEYLHRLQLEKSLRFIEWHAAKKPAVPEKNSRYQRPKRGLILKTAKPYVDDAEFDNDLLNAISESASPSVALPPSD